jgi:hypothetical protein
MKPEGVSMSTTPFAKVIIQLDFNHIELELQEKCICYIFKLEAPNEN